MNSLLRVSLIESHILHIELNRPDVLNVLNADLLKELQHVLFAAKENALVKAVLLTGYGKAFCAGADIKELLDLNAATGLQFAEQGQAVFRSLEQLGKPSLAAIQGFALGGGCELAMSATLRIATETSVLGQPEIKLGVIPGFGGTQRLARLVGKGRALDLCLSGRKISAKEACAWGLINEVVAVDQLAVRALEILRGLISLAPLAMKQVMAVIDEAYDLPLPQAFALEAAAFSQLCETQDKAEGVQAFLEKRPAHFKGV